LKLSHRISNLVCDYGKIVMVGIYAIVENIVGVNHLPGTGKINLKQQELITFLSRQKS
jgi:hypothetical protein